MLIETKTNLVDNRHAELTGVERLNAVNMFFVLEDLTAVREHIEDGESLVNEDKYVIYLKSGEYFIISTPYKKLFELYKHINYKSYDARK